MSTKRNLGRRHFMKLAGGAVASAGVMGAAAWSGGVLRPEEVLAQGGPGGGDADLYLAGTDGWMYLPPDPAIPPFHPDPLGPGDLNCYIFGFRNVTGLPDKKVNQQKYKAQHSAPMFWVNQFDPANPVDFKVKFINLGLELRPDLFDAHTIHWHGFRNSIPFFDGEPAGSLAIPANRDFTYVYRPREEGTYMYHCHVEEVEHVQMGMTGLVFVRPLQDGNTALYPSGKYLYNDGDGSTGFDREFSMFLSEVWAESHWSDAHIQLPEWSDYRVDFGLLNGRVYPDTLAPNGSLDPFSPDTDGQGDLIPPAGRPELQYQPYSALVPCNEGERVALRFANLGYRLTAMTAPGIEMRVVGKDATPMRGRDGTDTSYGADVLNIAGGESYDVVFTAPAYQGGAAGYDTYLLYNRDLTHANNLAAGGFGGQATEIRVYPAGTVGAQTLPNEWGI